MFLRTVLLLLFCCIASSLAAQISRDLETTTEASIITSVSEVGILLSVATCAFASVAIVIVPTMLYYKYCNQKLQDEVY